MIFKEMIFGDFTPGEKNAAGKAVGTVQSAYAAAAWKLKLNPDNLIEWLGLPFGVPLWYQSSDVEPAIAADLVQHGNYIKQWATTLRTNAERGYKETGTPYSFEDWISYGDELGKTAAYYAEVAWDSTGFKAMVDAIRQTAHDIKDPTAWPTWLKWAIGGVVGLAVLNILPRRR